MCPAPVPAPEWPAQFSAVACPCTGVHAQNLLVEPAQVRQQRRHHVVVHARKLMSMHSSVWFEHAHKLLVRRGQQR
eukprot:251152-Chlamydomonas_euryale.AAC.6